MECDLVTYSYCKTFTVAKNICRQSKLLEKYPVYLEHQVKSQRFIKLRKRHIDILSLDLIVRRVLQIKIAMAVYIKEQLFTLCNCMWMKDYILTANSTNTPPERYTLSGHLLVTFYEKTIQKILPWITAKRYLNFTTNEINIQKSRYRIYIWLFKKKGRIIYSQRSLIVLMSQWICNELPTGPWKR